MANLLNNGKRVIGWGAAMLLLGSLGMFFEFMGVGIAMAMVGIVLLVAGALFVLAGSAMLCVVASSWKTIVFGGGEAILSLILISTLFWIDGNVHGPMGPIVVLIAICGLTGMAVCLVGLIRLTLDRRSRRVA
jgi:hypothetical protein